MRLPDANRPPQAALPPDLTVRERVLLFCIAGGTDWQRAGVPGETLTGMTVRGLRSGVRAGGNDDSEIPS
jgi:hypothetical protein